MKKRTVKKAVKALSEGRKTPLLNIKLTGYVASMINKYYNPGKKRIGYGKRG